MHRHQIRSRKLLCCLSQLTVKGIVETEKSDGASITVGNVSDDCGSLLFKDRDIHELVEKKKQEEKRKYPEILQK